MRLCCVFAVVGVVAAQVSAQGDVPTTENDFIVPGSQIADLVDHSLQTSDSCIGCHGPLGNGTDPYSTWAGSLMAQAGRDPLFEAQMVTANQDVRFAGYFCMRCHVPLSIPTGHAMPPDGSALDYVDADGVTCHFCHSMVDPIYKEGISPPQDVAVLEALAQVPNHFANAMFVLDPSGLRRGTRPTVYNPHALAMSPFHATGNMCGTCHDVGNVCTTRQPDGSYRYNDLDTPAPDSDAWTQFPLERTFTEWQLSDFANGGVDMGGRFGGVGAGVVSTCQDCHMPKAVGQACVWGPDYPDLRRHDFAGASSWVLEIIAIAHADDPAVDPVALKAGQAAAIDMVRRAATLTATQECGQVVVRVTNESGHKIPTGHIEGRRIWVNVQFLDSAGALLRENGHYDAVEAHLDEASTVIYEMHVALSPEAAAITGYPPGVTTHMALADTIAKDNRIPPRGFNNALYSAAGAPAVGSVYADGQHWSDTPFAAPEGAAAVVVTLYYQTVTRHYIEALRNGNHTNNKGQELYDLWEQTGRGAPVEMATITVPMESFVRGDLTCDGQVGGDDLSALLSNWGQTLGGSDLNGDGLVDGGDLAELFARWN